MRPSFGKKLAFLQAIIMMNRAMVRRGAAAAAAAWMTPVGNTKLVTTDLQRRNVFMARPLSRRQSSWSDDWSGEGRTKNGDKKRQPNTSSWAGEDDRNRRERRPRQSWGNDNGGNNQGNSGRQDDRRRTGSSTSDRNRARDRGDRRRGGDERGDRRQVSRWNDKRNDQWSRNGSPDGNKRKSEDPGSRIDMKGLEAEGFVHLYGIAPVLSALKANRRDFKPREQETIVHSKDYQVEDGFYDDDDGDAFDGAKPSGSQTVKPEAQFTPWLFLQDRSGGSSGRSEDKMAAATEIKQLAQGLGIPVTYTDKGSLNALSGNRPHQGFVLRCGSLEFESLSRIPLPDPFQPGPVPNLWLLLDEIVDPQNLGALLRSSFFLGGGRKLGIVVCSKNSAPPSPVVSAASAGALELLDVYSTSSLPRTLALAREDGFRIIGAASSKPRVLDDSEVQLHDLQDLRGVNNGDDQPTILILGSEGHGLRTLVAKLCTDFVRIPCGAGPSSGVYGDEGDDNSNGIVDSLNVSVTGGILLWHLLYGSKQT